MHDYQRIELFGLFLGLLLSMGMFAVKAAVGGWHCMALHGKRRPWLLLALLVPYLLLFEAAHWTLRTIGLASLSEFSLKYFGLGVILHLLMCVGLVIWGYKLLTHPDTHCHSDRSWLLLAIPCPVCASAILLACVMAQLLLPNASQPLRFGLPLVFTILYLATFAGLWLFHRISGTSALHLAGWMMLLIAAYFVLLLMMSPQWTQLDRIHAVASHSIPPSFSGTAFWSLLAVFALAFMTGLLRSPRR
ncbi:MAG: hypothetical protein J6X49_13840 [Victivallales bacterium]|nr:hypothetical protein [Victivallales bacterium]